MASTRLVLIMGGGVSLGTYLAGALTEIFWALRNVNGDRAGSDGERRDVRVEVLAGASAGAMSAALFARALAADPAGIENLHRAWVREISIDALIGGGDAVDPRGLFSDRKILELADRMLAPPSDHREWQPFCASPLRVAFTLTNLGGVRYGIEYANVPGARRAGGRGPANGGSAAGGPARNGRAPAYFSTRIHRDAVAFELSESGSRTGPDTREGGGRARGGGPRGAERDGGAAASSGSAPDAAQWDAIREAAVASGAFPGAFPPRPLLRNLVDYDPAVFASDIQSPAPMWFVDGGALDNEPIGLAKGLVERNPDHQRLDYRYILIDPYLDSPLHGRNERLAPEPSSFMGVLGSLAGAVLGESSAKDWIKANRVNWRLGAHVEFVNRRLRPLVDAVREDAPAAAERVASGLAAQARAIAAFKRGVNRSEEPPESEVYAYLRANHDRIERDPRYADALAGLDGATREAMRTAIFVSESAAGLRDKEPMALHLIAPRGREEHPLAGDFLHNFGGFFREEWREHDFLCGRRDARDVLIRELLASSGEPLFDYPAEPGVDYDPEPVSAGPQDLTRTERAAFRDHLERRLDSLIRPRLPWYLRLFGGKMADRAAGAAMKQMGFRA